MNTKQARSLSDDLTSAWDAVEDDENELNESGPELEAATELDEEERQVETPDDDAVEEEPAIAAESDEKPVLDAAPDEDEAAPRGFTAAAREEWKNTPPAIRKEIAKREADFNKGIEKYRTQARKGDVIDQTITPYRQMFAQMGVQPPVLIGQLLQTAAILQGGNTAAKADLVANLTKQFGVDIGELDRALAGEGPSPQTQQRSQFQEELAPLQQELQQLRQFYNQNQQQAQQGIQQELTAFANNPANEFYRDVRMDMADIMESMAKRGQNIDLAQAYDRACYMNPEIRQVLEQRKVTQSLGSKRRASSSVRGTQGGSGGGVGGGSLRDTISAAFDQGNRV